MKAFFWKKRMSLLLCMLCLLCAAAMMANVFSSEPLSMYSSASVKTVQVSNVEEFLAAIHSNVEIVLAPGDYNLTQARTYGRGGGANYHWESAYDGYELVITDTENLTIRGADWVKSHLCTEPRYAYVLRFEDCINTTVADLTMGHTREPGECTGGVLQFSHCTGVEVVDARLYGCGTIGLDLLQCRDVHMDCSDIYDCSESAAFIAGCSNVLFENSKFYDIEFFSGLFEINGSENVAIVNSEIFNNRNRSDYYGSLFVVTCPDVYLGGLDVHDNAVHSVFNCPTVPVTVEKCRFQYSGVFWDEGVAPVAPDGRELTDGELAGMSLRIVEWTPAERVEIPAVEASADGKVHVRTVDEFLAAIDSNVTIYMEPGDYNLSSAQGYGGIGSEHYYWNMTYDGPELVIRSVSNLTIEGAGKDQVTITAEPRYANVLGFESCSGIILRSFTAGHTTKPGECSGGVLYFSYAGNVNVESCGLYGCGILGVLAMDCRNLYILNTEIYECSSGAAWFYGCSNVSVDGCNVHDNGDMEFYADYSCSQVLVDGKEVSSEFFY